MKNILTNNNLTIGITGASGFIGKELSKVLEKKYKIIKYDSHNLDLKKKVKLSKQIDVIYHLAAINKPYLSKIEPQKTFEVNVLGTLNLLEAIRKSNVKKIIFTSSILTYKNLTQTKETDEVGYNGIYPYGFEKLVGEEYIKMYCSMYGIDYVILRISGVYGMEMYKNPIFDIVQGYLNNHIKLYVNRNSVYNFIHINDVVSALIKSLGWKNKTFNVCSDRNIKLKDIYNFFGKKIKIQDTNFLIKIKGHNDGIKKEGWKEKHLLEQELIKIKDELQERMDKPI